MTTANAVTGTRVGWGALVDLINACRPDDTFVPDPADDPEGAAEWREAKSATMRAIAIMFGRGYGVGDYKAVFAYLNAELNAGTDTITIVNGLLTTWGRV